MLMWPEQKNPHYLDLAQRQTLLMDSKYLVPNSLKSITAITPRRKGKDSERDFLLDTYMWKEKHLPSQLSQLI